MYKSQFTAQFKKDYKKAKKRGLDLKKLHTIMFSLEAGNPLSAKYKDHSLVGNFIGFRECHIEPDWLLIYEKDDKNKVISYARTGTHADLFNK